MGELGIRDPEEVEVLAGLAGLAAADADCALLRGALTRVASDRDRALLLERGELLPEATLGALAALIAELLGTRPGA